MKKIFLTFIIAFALFGVASVFVPADVLAQTDGLEAVNDAAGLAEQDIRITVARLIRVFLGVLGIVAVGLVLYGGFTWMTAGGDPKKVEAAKRILINGLIGFVIIFASFSIASFVLSSLLRATGADGGALGGDDFIPGGGLGGSGTSSFIVADILPEGEVPIRNVEVQVVFSRTLDRTLDDSTIGEYVTISRADSGAIIDGTFNIGSNRVSFTPGTVCPDLEDVFCFDSFTTYRVTVDDRLRDADGRALDCRSGCSASFTTGDIIDLENPSVNFTYPEDRVQMFHDQEVQALATDDYGVSTGTFAIQGEEPFDSVPAPDPFADEVYLDAIWRTDGLEENVYYTLEVTARDLAGNTDVDILRVKAIPVHCFDGLLTEGEEEGIDCGIDCPSCDGIACVSDDDCAGICRDGFCASPPLITNIAPLFGSPGTYVTIQGNSFGRTLGSVEFTGSEGPIDVLPVACSEGWTNDQLIVQVPEGAIQGPVTVIDSDGLRDTSSDAYGPIFADFAPIGGIGINVCGISPENGLSGSVVVLEGDGFGDRQEDGLVTFGIE
ncbi:MAG: IPT/TIG domain-containing protein, partial [bacterium]|nr:IPT/TIG domain-containing protein [bacterium]